MILGANPEEKQVEDNPFQRPPKPRRVDPVRVGIVYFVYHPKTKMYQVFTQEDRAILGRSIKALLNRGLSLSDLCTAIDRFYATEYALQARPVLFFTKTFRQNSLVQDMSLLDHEDYRRQFIAFGFERAHGLELPWDEVWDTEIKRRCIGNPEEALDIIEEYCGAF